VSLGFVLAGVGSGCGGSTPASSTPAQPAHEAESAPQVVPLELEPAPAPKGTFLWGRLKNPAGLADSVIAATAIPLNWRAELEDRVPNLTSVIALDAPVEVAFALDDNPSRQPHGVVSFGVGSEGVVLAELEREGISVRSEGEGERWFSLEDVSCALGPSLGATPVRVVCSDDDASLAVLLPYALRGLPREELSDAEAHLEFRAAPLKAAYGSQLRSLKLLASVAARQVEIDNSRFDRAAADALLALADEGIRLARDLERVTLQLRARQAGDYELSLSGSFEGRSSWTASSVELLGQTQSVPPDLFWKLPATSSGASFARTLPKEQVSAIHGNLVELLGGWLEHQKLGEKTRVRIERFVMDMLAYDGVFVSATGPVVPLSTSSGTQLGAAWQLVGLEADAAGYKKRIDELALVLSSADLRKAAGTEAQWIPELKARGALADRPGSAIYEWQLKGGAVDQLVLGLSHGGGGRELENAAQLLQHGFLVVVPDGGRTWLAWSTERSQLDAPFQVLFKSGSPRLETVSGLTPLREKASAVSGFLRLEGLVGPISAELAPERAKSWEALSRGLPYGGKVPVTFHVRAEPGQKSTIEIVERVPHEFVADLTALLIQTFTRD
jgi:hypothetical protein